MSKKYTIELEIEVGEAGPMVNFVRIMSVPTAGWPVTISSKLMAWPEPKPKRRKPKPKEPT